MFYLRFPLFLTLFLPPEVVRAPGPRQQPKQARLLCLSPEFESSLRESSSPALDKLHIVILGICSVLISDSYF